ncbi:ubiquinone biosynthesis protein COQ8, mitochondrial [Dermatophagoides pteronyssinus]|uniref:Atypical kinase COQ8B, mitochondrial-like n=1 Tax=Dermatophagoides pteronyssinus TaxID=6956 RepID=A0A6P6XUG5_DERPT|nr:atypical kinase COQ8B, mitochondrial-like [Dermatophagoides pteronyssinus]
MSSNYRILLHFLTTLDDAISVATGFRGNPHLLNRIRQSLVEQSKIDVSKLKKFQPSSELDLRQLKIDPKSVIDDVTIVAEGLRQYANYVAKHSVKVKPMVKPPIIELPNLIPPRPSILLEEEKHITKPVVADSPRPSTTKPVINKQNPREQSSKQSDGSKFRTNYSTPKRSLDEVALLKLSEKARERKVPANRFARVLSFGGLAVSMGFGAAEELAKRVVGAVDNDKVENSVFSTNLFLTKNNAQKIVDTLCQVRGAALKLGQMLSIQDNELLGPELQAIFERVRQSADYMPESQLVAMLSQELGSNWRSLFSKFDMKPFAAASIGQVHHAQLDDGSLVAVKVQYPGVADSIESDIKNVLTIIKYANIFPEGLFIDHIMNYAKVELAWEVDYCREAQCQIRYGNLIREHSYQEENLRVPRVYESLSTKKILTTELISGIPIDKLDDYAETSDPNVKNSVMERILRLFFRELFVFNYMQTDPNWSNFFYDYKTDTLSLIDFGNCRPFSEQFVMKYHEIIEAAIENDRQTILDKSLEIGFLTGYETEMFKNAHADSVLIIGEALRISDRFDFSRQSVIKRINNQLPILLKHRLKPPPEEIYSLHRKLSGLFLLCCKLKVQVNCRAIYDDVINQMIKLKQSNQ